MDWAPAYELHEGPTKVVGGYVVNGLLDRWHRQGHLPPGINTVGRWLMDQVGYTPPPGPSLVYPPQAGRGHPRHQS